MIVDEYHYLALTNMMHRFLITTGLLFMITFIAGCDGNAANKPLDHESLEPATVNSTWKKYQDNTYGFQIQYPPDWEIRRLTKDDTSISLPHEAGYEIFEKNGNYTENKPIFISVTNIELQDIPKILQKKSDNETFAAPGAEKPKINFSTIESLSLNGKSISRGSHTNPIGIDTVFYYFPLKDEKALYVEHLGHIEQSGTIPSINESIIATLTIL